MKITSDLIYTYFKICMRHLFGHVGLCVLVCCYCAAGVMIFRAFEAEGEIERKRAQVERSVQIEELRQNVTQALYDARWSAAFNETLFQLMNYLHGNITDAIQNFGYTGVPLNESDMKYGWSVPSALLFTITIVTTIGYGHICPVTEGGQLVVIIYAIVGCPLMVMFLANIGDVMATLLLKGYIRGCCFPCRKTRGKNYERLTQPGTAKGEPATAEVLLNRRKSAAEPHGCNPRIPIAPPRITVRMAWESDDVKPPEGPTPHELEGEQRTDNVEDLEINNETALLKSDDAPVDVSPATIHAEAKQSEVVVVEVADDIEEMISVPISLTLLIIVSYIFIGAVLFSAWNGWTLVQAAYFTFVTLSTIGFGDLVPGLDEVGTMAGNLKLAASSFYIVLGLAVLTMCFNLMIEEMISMVKRIGIKLGLIEPATPIADDELDDDANEEDTISMKKF